MGAEAITYLSEHVSEKSRLGVQEPDGTASEGKEDKVLADDTSMDVIKGTFEAGVAKTSSNVDGSQRENRAVIS